MASSPPSDDRAAADAADAAVGSGPAGTSIGSVVLVGMMGAGKTAVGTALAGILDRPFLDSDREIERIAGATVAQIFAASGEGVFRDLESRVMRDALARPDPVVIAPGGGVVLDEGNRRLLREHEPVVWLRARVDTLVARVGSGKGRPLLDHDVAATMARLDAARRPLYEEVADLIVDVDGTAAPAAGAISRETKIAEATATAARIATALTAARTSTPTRSGVDHAPLGGPERNEFGQGEGEVLPKGEGWAVVDSEGDRGGEAVGEGRGGNGYGHGSGSGAADGDHGGRS